MPIIVAIAGGTGSGKTTLANAVANALGEQAAIIRHDWYYRDQRHLTPEQRLETNYDHPNALETDLLVAQLTELQTGKAVQAPQYDFTQHLRCTETRLIEPRPVMIVEGIHVLGDAALREIADVRIFVDTDTEIRLNRRIDRDTAERGRTRESVVRQFEDQVRPMHDAFVEPAKAYADLVVPGERDIEGSVSHCLGVIRVEGGKAAG